MALLGATCFAQKIDSPSNRSDNNLEYSFYKPSKKIFIDNAKKFGITNERLKDAYADPSGSVGNGLFYAIAQDYVNKNGSEEVRNFYKLASMENIWSLIGYKATIQYADFLIRTKRYNALLNEIKPSMCGTGIHQCEYYRAVAKHLAHIPLDKEECDKALQFPQMRNATLSFCK